MPSPGIETTVCFAMNAFLLIKMIRFE
jgi:hypothetical protein